MVTQLRNCTVYSGEWIKVGVSFVFDGIFQECDLCKDNIDINSCFFWLHKHVKVNYIIQRFMFHISTWLTMNIMAKFSQMSFQICSLERNLSILIKVSLKVVLCGPVDDIWALIQIMAWHLARCQAITWIIAGPDPGSARINSSLWPYLDLIWDPGALTEINLSTTYSHLLVNGDNHHPCSI